ncbi:hypothetical protein RvY_03680 [Ramazzottius varieornatus]|uniref:DDE Tnp4 domain-containing protein n=1 Tax=Ramazzottius varieornatus TaxID=947166 RepID=A0A1D1UUK6_RAMVA|nr:hypothetical protein RvY_03680 [Ramazzottius varieornatus]
MLKGKFQSLKALRGVLNTAEDHRKIVYWIRACCVLHNLLTSDYYNPEWDDSSEDESASAEEKHHRATKEIFMAEGGQKRELLK